MAIQRILILSSSTGGGHDMRADALTAWLKLECPQVEVFRWQALEQSSGLDRFGVALYNTIQRNWPLAHHIYFNFLEYAGLHRQQLRSSPRQRFLQILNEAKPNVVVSVHAHLNHAYFDAVREFDEKIRCLTYCGELSGGYGFSRHWVNPRADGFIGAVEECASAARQLGMPADRCRVGGFLLRPAFFDQSTTDSGNSRMRLWGSKSDGPVVLLGTGANGANRHLAAIKALANTGMSLTVVALCGRNQLTFERLQREAPKWPKIKVIPLAYQQNMTEILRSVDLAFIRPGTGTTSECLVVGCPVLFNGIGGVMPQEHITVRFLQQRGYPARVANSPRAFAREICCWFSGDWKTRAASQKELLLTVNKQLHPREIIAEVLK